MPTHGSITKAGKVRNQTPKLPHTTKRIARGPRLRNRHNFVKLLKKNKEVREELAKKYGWIYRIHVKIVKAEAKAEKRSGGRKGRGRRKRN